MSRGNRELWMAALAILVITLVYLLVIDWLQAIPAAGGLFGHSLGVLGFLLMLMTEGLYSLRKRTRSARWGRMAAWLQFHIFTGLVGPYLVLLHTSWKFQGLAGVVMLLTVVIVASGFIGRYIYTSVPRTVDGVELGLSDLEAQINTTESELNRLSETYPALSSLLTGPCMIIANGQSGLLIGRMIDGWSFQRQWTQAIRRLPSEVQRQAQALGRLVKQRSDLHRQMATLASARRLLSLWHAIHIPIGAALFTAAFIHAIGALYYGTLLR